MAVSDAEPRKNELVDDGLRGITDNPKNDHNDHNDDDHDDDSRPVSKYSVNGKKINTSSRHNNSVVDTRNDHVKEHHQEDNTYNSSRRGDDGRVDYTGAFRGDKTVSEVDGGGRKEFLTTIHHSSYGNHTSVYTYI